MQCVNDLNMLVAVFLKAWFSCGANDMTLIKEVKREEKARVIFQSNDRELNLDDQLFHFKLSSIVIVYSVIIGRSTRKVGYGGKKAS